MAASAAETTNVAQPARRRVPFPLRALIERMGSNAEAHPWSGYLPEQLRSDCPTNAAATAFAAASPVHMLQVVPAMPIWAHQPGAMLPTLLVSGRPGADVFVPCSSFGGQHGAAGGGFHMPGQSCGGPTGGVAGRVWGLSQDPQGSREVQYAIDTAISDGVRVALTSELRGHICEALRCPHANHVVQKCIMSLRPYDSQFIIDELMARPSSLSQAARHKYGCRIIQRLVERCLPQQVHSLVESLLSDAVQIARHPYGNYVMQHLLEHGTAEQKHQLVRILERNVVTIGQDNYGCAVIGAAMSHPCLEHQRLLARAILKEPGLLLFLAFSRHGHGAVVAALQALEGPELQEARQQLMADMSSLRSSRYGRMIAALLEGTA